MGKKNGRQVFKKIRFQMIANNNQPQSHHVTLQCSPSSFFSGSMPSL